MKRSTIAFAVLTAVAGSPTMAFTFSTIPYSSSRGATSRFSLSTSTRLFLGDRTDAKTKDRLSLTTTTTPSSSSSTSSSKGLLTDFSVQPNGGFSYVRFAKEYPFVNNIGIATVKTAAADLLAQTVIAGTPFTEIDVQRSFLFCLFGALYLGAFQYAYQVNVFKKLFDVDSFTNKAWSEKLQDIPGLKALGAQTGLDLTVLTLIYLPTFYIFKASVFSGSIDPSLWFATGIENYQTNFSKDEADLIKVWLPADLVCFSVPLYLRLPVRHIVSFVWTAYLSFARGGH
jgi:Mpv17 / PMP22 family